MTGGSGQSGDNSGAPLPHRFRTCVHLTYTAAIRTPQPFGWNLLLSDTLREPTPTPAHSSQNLVVSTHEDPQSGIAVVLWVGGRLAHSCFWPLVLPTPAPKPSSFPCPTGPGKHLLTPTSSQGSCPSPKGFSPRPHIGPFKGPYLPELLPTEGVLAFFLKDPFLSLSQPPDLQV